MRSTQYKYTIVTQIHRRLRCSGMIAFINFWLQFFDTRRETQFLKIFRNHTMQMTLQRSANLVVQSQFLNIIVGTQLHLSAIEADNPTVYLHGLKSTPNWFFFKIFKFSGPSLPGMPSFTLQPHFHISGVYYDNCDWRILCARA